MKAVLLLFGFTFALFSSSAQGEFAGSMKKLIGLKYKDSKTITSLKGYEFRSGSLISDINDPETITVDHFQKGPVAIVFFSIKEDPNAEEFTIMDVLEYKSIPEGWQIKTAFCRQNENENAEIVALVKSTNEELLKPARQAWRFNRDKRKIQSINKADIDCISEGGD